ncbi:hypothetical protein MNB_SV-10-863 [hydrothermal vent metagenome]|uniref:Lipoprotein n=1 Tax=hydrothermal vent metagenome TaxID=652676 RepID=A0A1W1CLQ2_9ZZZZ
MKYLKPVMLLAVSSLLFTACGGPHHVPQSQGGFYYDGIYFGKNFSETFKEGIEDGCKTAQAHYTKNHTLFQIDKDYNDGWFLGRSRCIPLFKVEEDGEPVNSAEG